MEGGMRILEKYLPMQLVGMRVSMVVPPTDHQQVAKLGLSILEVKS
jgi:hypothetical protein